MTDPAKRRSSGLLSEIVVVAAMGLVTLAIGAWLSRSVALSLPPVLLIATASMLVFLTLHGWAKARACARREAVVVTGAGLEEAPAAVADHGAMSPVGPKPATVDTRPGSDVAAGTNGVADPVLRGSIAPEDEIVIAPWPAEMHADAPAEPAARSLPREASGADGTALLPSAPLAAAAAAETAAPARGGPAQSSGRNEDALARSVETFLAAQRLAAEGSRSEATIADAHSQDPRQAPAAEPSRAGAAAEPIVAPVTAAPAAPPTLADGPGAPVLGDAATPTDLEAAHMAGGLRLLLQPIADLGDGSARHIELSAEVALLDGRVLAGSDLRRAAREAGMLSMIDGEKLAAAAGVVRRLAARERQQGAIETTVHSGLAGESLTDDDFLDAFAATVVGEAAFTRHLVMAFTQGEVRGFSRAQWGALSVMAEHGFRFSLEAVTDLDMDFEALARAGFGFVKLDAEVLSRGMAVGPDAVVPAADICRHLSDHGLALIVGSIDDERQLAEVMGFGVLLGQGTLFGAPRPLRSSARPPARTAEHAAIA